jgi:hypothetical protein
MANLVAIFSLVAAIILQTSIVVRINILHGAADLVLLTLLAWVIHDQSDSHWRWGILVGLLVGFATALPFWIVLGEYVMVIWILSAIQARVWQAPMLILFSSVFFGTFIINGIDFLYLWISGISLNIDEVFTLVILPSLVINVILALPIFAIIGEIAKQVFPLEVEV